MEECRECDGCGWVEGGRTLKTECSRCHGTGQVTQASVRRAYAEAKRRIAYHQKHGVWPSQR
jgi:RecJ-like exonuclease